MAIITFIHYTFL